MRAAGESVEAAPSPRRVAARGDRRRTEMKRFLTALRAGRRRARARAARRRAGARSRGGRAQPWGSSRCSATIMLPARAADPAHEVRRAQPARAAGVAGALILGAPARALGDVRRRPRSPTWSFLRRSARQSRWINAGREVVALVCGVRRLRVGVGVDAPAARSGLTTETLPALLLFVVRVLRHEPAAAVLHAPLRDKLVDEEKSLILRYEVIAFGAGTIGVAIVLVDGHEPQAGRLGGRRRRARPRRCCCSSASSRSRSPPKS